MKTSTIMIITAVLITLGSLTAFNIDVKQIYLTGAYKNRFKGMDFTPLKGVENIDILTANRMGVRIEKGDKEGIWINASAKNRILATVNLKTLKLDLSEDSKADGFRSWNDVVITTRKLGKLNLGSYYLKTEQNGYNSGDITITGYTQDQLDLIIGKSVNVSLNAMNINILNANIGDQKEGQAELTVSSDTKINTALFNIPGKSKLTLDDPKIVKVTYNLSDSATVSLSGKVVQMIK